MTRVLPALLVALWMTSIAGGAASQSRTPSAAEIFARSLEAIKAVDSYRDQFVMRELIGDDLVSSKVHFKFKRPFKVYMNYVTSPEGQEVLFVRGKNDNKILARKGSFPDLTVNLSPYGRMAMKGTRQPILTFGLRKQIEIMGHIYRKAVATGEVTYTVKDAGVFMGEPVWEIDARLPSTGKTVKVLKNENLWKSAKRVGQTMYVILRYNDIRSPSSIDE